MTINFKRAESFNKPPRTEQVVNGWYVRKNFAVEQVANDPQNEENLIDKYTYDEAFLTDREYEIMLIGQEISGENYQSDAYLNYKAKLETPVVYPANGYQYKPVWIKNAKGEDGTYIDLYDKAEKFPDLMYPIPLWDVTNDPAKVARMTKEEFVSLITFLGSVQEQLYNQYKLAKGEE